MVTSTVVPQVWEPGAATDGTAETGFGLLYRHELATGAVVIGRPAALEAGTGVAVVAVAVVVVVALEGVSREDLPANATDSQVNAFRFHGLHLSKLRTPP